ncbi:MAG: class I SAM-dependent methyltransferase [Leptolyngbyaceae cyanobacterium bins.59]|nr:class I SAM-dependent methyltransferase [Leptolyngbyaceae cyanobacterium bins.59]
MTTLNDFQLQNGVYFPPNSLQQGDSQPKQLWEKIAAKYYADESVKDEYVPNNLPLTGERGGIWPSLPPGQHFDSILEIGCGYGRASIYLSKRKEFTCKKYYCLDIAETMLRNLLKYKQEFNFYPAADVFPICMSAGEDLPLEDNSVNLVISDSVFMHITLEQVKRTLAEVKRVLRPGGSFIFHNSFYNKNSPKHVIHNTVRLMAFWRIKPLYLKQYSLEEVDELIKASGLPDKAAAFTILPSEPAVIPTEVGGVAVPFSSTINSLNYPESWRGVLARTYSVYSNNLLKPAA